MSREAENLPEFRMERQLPSCDVDKSLLAEIERYIRSHVPHLLSVDPEAFASRLHLSVSDGFGTETIDSISDYMPSLFPDSILSTVYELIWLEDSEMYLRIQFHRSRNQANMYIKCRSERPRETAVSIHDAVFRLVKARRNRNWLFHSELLAGFLAPVLLVNALIVGAVLVARGWTLSGSALLFGALWLVLYMLLGVKAHPYCAFDCTGVREAKRLWNWAAGGFAGFLIFAVILGSWFDVIAPW